MGRILICEKCNMKLEGKKRLGSFPKKVGGHRRIQGVKDLSEMIKNYKELKV